MSEGLTAIQAAFDIPSVAKRFALFGLLIVEIFARCKDFQTTQLFQFACVVRLLSVSICVHLWLKSL